MKSIKTAIRQIIFLTRNLMNKWNFSISFNVLQRFANDTSMTIQDNIYAEIA